MLRRLFAPRTADYHARKSFTFQLC